MFQTDFILPQSNDAETYRITVNTSPEVLSKSWKTLHESYNQVVKENEASSRAVLQFIELCKRKSTIKPEF